MLLRLKLKKARSCFCSCVCQFQQSFSFSIQKLDCKLDFFNPPDLQWGYVHRGKSYGMFKLLQEKKIDIMACSQYEHVGSFQVGHASYVVPHSNFEFARLVLPRKEYNYPIPWLQ